MELSEKQIVYHKKISRTFDENGKEIDVVNILNSILKIVPEIEKNKVEHINIALHRFSILAIGTVVFFVFTYRTTSTESVTKYILNKIRRKYFEIIEKEQFSESEIKEKMDKYILEIIANFPIKALILGNKLKEMRKILNIIKGGFNEETVEKITDELIFEPRGAILELNKHKIIINLLNPSEYFTKFWPDFFEDTDIFIVVMDSTIPDLDWVKDTVLPLIKENNPFAHIFIVADNQGAQGAIDAEYITSEIELPIIPLNVNENNFRDKFVSTLKKYISSRCGLNAGY
ncbi:MAG: hypothetical protein ACTSQY_02870 [Candidatus Odinarchaeia archaeon]